MDIKQQWQKLAQDLELDFGEDLRPTIELPSMHFMAAKALKSGKLSQSEAILSNPKSSTRFLYFIPAPAFKTRVSSWYFVGIKPADP